MAKSIERFAVSQKCAVQVFLLHNSLSHVYRQVSLPGRSYFLSFRAVLVRHRIRVRDIHADIKKQVLKPAGTFILAFNSNKHHINVHL